MMEICKLCGYSGEHYESHDCAAVLLFKKASGAQTNETDEDKDARIRSLEHDHKVMREALEQYANERNWGMNETNYADNWIPTSDGLTLARTTLSSLLVKDGE